MRVPVKLTIATVTVALGFAPIAFGHSANHGRWQSAPGHNKSQQTTANHRSSTTPSLGSKAKAYGRLCQTESKKHVAGQKGTPFSKCVTDMAHLAANAKTNPARACANESKKHVAGQKGTPYSQCVSAAAKLRRS